MVQGSKFKVRSSPPQPVADEPLAQKADAPVAQRFKVRSPRLVVLFGTRADSYFLDNEIIGWPSLLVMESIGRLR